MCGTNDNTQIQMALLIVDLRTFDAHYKNCYQEGFFVVEHDWFNGSVWLRGTQWAPQIERRLIGVAQINNTCVMRKDTVLRESFMWPIFLAYNVRAAIRVLAMETKLPRDLVLVVRSYLWW